MGYTYTGQYSHIIPVGGTADFGLMFYNARWYDPSLGRFAQADSIIPDGMQGLDRYAYVNNSPMNYVDPSGHTAMCGVSCEEEYEKSQHRNNGGTLSRDQIRQLLGFGTDNELSSWINANENNNKFYMLLDYAQPGDIIRTQWNNNTNNLMIVQHNHDLAFYSIEAKSLLGKEELNGFTQGSSNSLQGAGILSHEGGNQYLETPYVFGQVDMEDYSLQNGWNRQSDGTGGVIMVKNPTNIQLLLLFGGLTTIIGGGVSNNWAGNKYSVLTGLTAFSTGIISINSQVGTPYYFDQFPYTN